MVDFVGKMHYNRRKPVRDVPFEERVDTYGENHG